MSLKLLYGAYRRSLELAVENDCHSIAFPLISAGIFGYPKDKAWRKAIQACKDFFEKDPDADLQVFFAVLDDGIMDIGNKTLDEIAPEYKVEVEEGRKNMTNTELTKIREDRKLSKSDFAKLLGVTPMLLGRYEKGSCAIPEAIVGKLKDTAVASEIEVKKNTRKAGRKVKETVEGAAAVVKEAVEDKIAAEEIEAKKTARKVVRTAKEAAEEVAQSDPVVAAEIEVKKNTRKAGRKAKETASAAKDAVKEAAGIPNIIIQSPIGGYITPADIARKVPKGTEDVYVRVDENKLYYVLKNGETGNMDIWE